MMTIKSDNSLICGKGNETPSCISKQTGDGKIRLVWKALNQVNGLMDLLQK